MQARQTTGESGGGGSIGTDAAMMQGGQEADAGGQDGSQAMEHTFTYAFNPSLQFEITVSVKPVNPPTAALVGGPGGRPK